MTKWEKEKELAVENLEDEETRIDKRIRELEQKACSRCWEHCYDYGLTDTEKEEYDEIVYELPRGEYK